MIQHQDGSVLFACCANNESRDSGRPPVPPSPPRKFAEKIHEPGTPLRERQAACGEHFPTHCYKVRTTEGWLNLVFPSIFFFPAVREKVVFGTFLYLPFLSRLSSVFKKAFFLVPA